jgi:hypothetical protein
MVGVCPQANVIAKGALPKASERTRKARINASCCHILACYLMKMMILHLERGYLDPTSFARGFSTH